MGNSTEIQVHHAMNTRDPQALIEKLKNLPPERVAEVGDFVDFLRTRVEERALVRAAGRASEPAFAEVWDNDDNRAYDQPLDSLRARTAGEEARA